MSNTSTVTPPPGGRRRGLASQSAASWVVALLFALLSACWVWAGVANLFYTFSFFGFDLTVLAWFVLIGSILVPVVTYGLGFWAAWRLPAWAKAVVLLVALAAAMVLKFDLEALLLSRT